MRLGSQRAVKSINAIHELCNSLPNAVLIMPLLSTLRGWFVLLEFSRWPEVTEAGEEEDFLPGVLRHHASA